MRTCSTILVLLILLPSSALAQHDHGHSPYAGTQSADLPSLTDEEVGQLRAGEGMGLARPAELNHYPGPKHSLELGEALALTEDQILRITAIHDAMLDQAVEKGEEILTVEGHLNATFATGTAAASGIERMTRHLGLLRGELSFIHLEAHLDTRAVLTDDQVGRYDELRGYPASGG